MRADGEGYVRDMSSQIPKNGTWNGTGGCDWGSSAERRTHLSHFPLLFLCPHRRDLVPLATLRPRLQGPQMPAFIRFGVGLFSWYGYMV